MLKRKPNAAFRAAQRKGYLPVVRALRQFGPSVNIPKTGLKLFLDDARNPPLHEEGWIVVRSVWDAAGFMIRYGHLVTVVSLDNDLNEKLEGHDFLKWLLDNSEILNNVRKIVIHTGNDPKARLMRKMLLGSSFIIKRIIPSHRIYPNARDDLRRVVPYKETRNVELQPFSRYGFRSDFSYHLLRKY